MKAFLVAILVAQAAAADGVPPGWERPVHAKRKAARAEAAAPAQAESAPAQRAANEAAPANAASSCVPPKPERAATDPQIASNAACLPSTYPDRSCLARHPLCDRDREAARIAWQYFVHNTQKTGLVNAVNDYPSTTLWDAGSSVVAILAARELDLISQKELDDRISALLGALATMKLYRDEAPNKAYNAALNEMSDYGNQPSPAGIGFSALDLGRLASTLSLTACMHPRHETAAAKVLSRWSYCRMTASGELHGAQVVNGQDDEVQEGRIGYEQYAAKAFGQVGFELPKIARYHNGHAKEVTVEGVKLLADKRGADTGAYNYVTTESYALDAMENGLDDELEPLLRSVLEAQRRRAARTGIPTAVTEDNIDRAPWFLYSTLWAAETPWAVITDRGEDLSALRTLSTKATFSLAALFPEDSYVPVLTDAVRSAYDPNRGWYAGIYESGAGYNRALTANTNGVILETMLYKLYGPLHAACARCKRGLVLPPLFLDDAAAKKLCMPAKRTRR